MIIILICILIEIRSGQFLSINNIVDIIRSAVVPSILGIGVLMVILIGGIDLSFISIAALSMYSVNFVITQTGYSGSVLLPYAIAALIGVGCDALNAFVISRFNLPTMIVTLGTSSIFTSILRGVLNAKDLVAAPVLKNFGRITIFVAENNKSGLKSNLPITIFIPVGLFALTYFILRYTLLGRGIYAIGGDKNAARRAGFNTSRIQYFVYCYVGLLAGITGVTRTCMSEAAHYSSLLGTELVIIAAIVLGGACITGGMGTLTGTVFGTLLMTIVSNSLVLIGIPTYWQTFFTGALIIAGTGISVYRASKSHRRRLAKQTAAMPEGK